MGERLQKSKDLYTVSSEACFIFETYILYLQEIDNLSWMCIIVSVFVIFNPNHGTHFLIQQNTMYD